MCLTSTLHAHPTLGPVYYLACEMDGEAGNKPTAPKGVWMWEKMQSITFTEEKRDHQRGPSQKGGLYGGSHMPAILYYCSFAK